VLEWERLTAQQTVQYVIPLVPRSQENCAGAAFDLHSTLLHQLFTSSVGIRRFCT
jgi:hypothetical protein